jgi:hypothetical protein
VSTYIASTPEDADGDLPAREGHINNGTSRSNAHLIVEVEPGAEGDFGASLIPKGTEDVIDSEAQANFALIYWHTTDGRVYLVKSPSGRVGHISAPSLNSFIADVAALGPASVNPAQEHAGSDSVSRNEDRSLTYVVSVSPPSDSVPGVPTPTPDFPVVIQAKRGPDGHLYLLSGERLSEAAYNAADYVYEFASGGLATVHKNVHGRTGRTRASVVSIEAAKTLRLADKEGVRKLAENTFAIILPRKNGPSASLADYAMTFAAITFWPKILDEAKLSIEDLDGLISRVNDCVFHHGFKYADGSIGIQVESQNVPVTLCGTASAPWCWPGDRTAEEIAGLGLLRALKAYRSARKAKAAPSA